MFGRVEIEREMACSAAAFEPLRCFCFVSYKAVDANAQKSSQARFRRIEIIQIFLFKQPREKILRQVFGVFIRFAPADAYVFVDGLPVGSSNRFKSSRPLRRVAIARCQNSGPARRREFSARSADL